jgi:hypothetical protein
VAGFDCPECGNPLSTGGLCKDCGYRLKQTPRGNSRAASHQLAEIPAAWTKEQRQENQRLCAPIIAKVHEQLKAINARPRTPGMMPHALAAVATKGISYDPEAIAEREAIEREGRLG